MSITLFTPFTLASGQTLRNRIAKAAMEEAHARMCERGRWVCNEKRLIDAAGLTDVQAVFAQIPSASRELLPWIDRVADMLQATNDAATPWRDATS